VDVDLPNQISELLEMLQRLAALDASCRVFGASAHRYYMGPVLSEKVVSTFEAAHQISLPADYRLFLTSVGNGGAGPYYGLSLLADTTSGARPGEPLPWTKAVFVCDPSHVGLTAADIDPQKSDGSELTMPLPGSLFLTHEGCGYYQFLVVNGPAYGTIWSDWRPADCGLVPSGLTFVLWYRRWLERCLARIAREGFVDQLAHGMPQADVIQLLGNDFSQKPSKSNPRETVISYRDAAVVIFLADGVVTRITRTSI
jgi:hypothetical protein